MNNFTFISTFYDDLKGLPYEQRCKVIDALCYWGVYRELPQEVADDAIVKALLANPQRMITGQDVYREKAKEAGKQKKGHMKITNEEIIGAYFDFRKQGIVPSERQVVEKCGYEMRINARPVWQNRERIWQEFCKNGTVNYDTNLTNVNDNLTTDVVSNCNNEDESYNNVTTDITSCNITNLQTNKPIMFDF